MQRPSNAWVIRKVLNRKNGEGMIFAHNWLLPRFCLKRLGGRARLKCDDTRAETRFGLSGKRTNPFNWRGGGSVQSTTGSRGVRISGNNAGYTMF